METGGKRLWLAQGQKETSGESLFRKCPVS